MYSAWSHIGRRQAASSEAAFTLFELLVVVAVFLAVLAFAAPDLPELLSSSNRQVGRQLLDFDLRRARSEALAEGARVVMTIDSDGAGYSLGYDYIPYSTATPVAVDETIFQRNLPSRVTITANQQVIFDSHGMLIDKDGLLANTNVTLRFDGVSYTVGTIYPAGVVEYY